jgi:hypothetical protein
MHSRFSDLCQRSIFRFGEVRTCVIPEMRMNSLKSRAMIQHAAQVVERTR